MLKIGEFSRLSRISVRMLRHYDRLGILKPAYIDRFTDYRYYIESQLPVACRIAALRDMGFPLAEIGDILPCYDDAARLAACIQARRAALIALQEDTAHKLRLLDTALERLRKEENMNYDVTIRTLPARYAATVRMTIPRYEDERMLWHYMLKETRDVPLDRAEPPYRTVTFLDAEYKERDIDVEASMAVKGSYADTQHVKFKSLPAVTYAGCICKGAYEQLSEAIAAVTAWIEANGYEHTGPLFDIYHVSPHDTTNPDEFVTEVCFPVRKG